MFDYELLAVGFIDAQGGRCCEILFLPLASLRCHVPTDAPLVTIKLAKGFAIKTWLVLMTLNWIYAQDEWVTI